MTALASRLVGRRLLVTAALVGSLGTAVAVPAVVHSDSGHARPQHSAMYPGYYRCWIQGYGWMWCKDV